MDVHASPAELPALSAFLSAFEVRFRRPEGREALERYTTGRLTERPHKHCDPMAQAVPGPSAQRLQEFLTHRPGDDEDLNRQRVQKMRAEASLGDGVLGLDDTGFPTPGQASVGVARQYAGPRGKVGNCQVAVTCCDTEPQATWPGAGRVYGPAAWAAAAERRRQARVAPAGLFQTKPELALTLLDQARAWGVPQGCVVADADDGDNPKFLAGLERRQERSVVGGRADFRGRDARPAASPSPRADQRLQAMPRAQWRTSRWRQGSPGWLRQKFIAVRCWRVTPEGQRRLGGLLGERARRGQPAERKDYGRTLPASATLEELAGDAHRRHAIEPFPEEAQGELGWDHDQGRLWPGFHRQAVTVMRAYRVLVWLELRQRQSQKRRGRPRNPCSPAARSVASHAAGRASTGRPVAAPPDGAVVGDNGSVHGALFTVDLTK